MNKWKIKICKKKNNAGKHVNLQIQIKKIFINTKRTLQTCQNLTDTQTNRQTNKQTNNECKKYLWKLNSWRSWLCLTPGLGWCQSLPGPGLGILGYHRQPPSPSSLYRITAKWKWNRVLEFIFHFYLRLLIYLSIYLFYFFGVGGMVVYILSCVPRSSVTTESVKGLSHWRRRRRELRQLGRPKNCLRSHQRDVAATGGQHMACALMSQRRLQDLLETEKSQQKKIEHVWISRDSPETRLVSRRPSRRRHGDVSATRLESPSSRHLVSRPVR